LHFSEKKINDFIDQDYQELYKYLTYISELSGIKKPSKEILKDNMMFLKEAFGDFSIAEIKKSFTMAYSFQLEIEDLNHYGSLTPLWLGKILNAYKNKRANDLIEYEKERRKLAQTEKEEVVTEEMINSRMANFTMLNFEKYKETKDFSDLGASTYKFLVRNEIINPTIDEKEKAMIKAKESLLKRSMNDKYKNSLNRVVKSLSSGTEAEQERLEARDILVIEFFDMLIETKVEIKDILKRFL
jgi:hypothetical protein